MTEPRTARQIIINWANQQHHWVRGVVREVLETHQALPDPSLENAFNEALAQYGLADSKPTEAPKLLLAEAEDELSEKLSLRTLREVQNVNRLATGQSIAFNSRMTVLFGENATGKSGYVRILKSLAAVRSAEPILPDIHASTRTAASPEATIDFTLGTADDSVSWHGNQGLRPFTRMSVFDTRAVSLHLEGDLTYVYTPRDLALFKYTHEAIQSVRERIARARDEARPAGNPFLHRFDRGSAIYTQIETLGASSDLASLERLAFVAKEEAATLPSLRTNVNALRSDTLASVLEVARNDREVISSIVDVSAAVNAFDWSRYNGLLSELQDAERKLTNATRDALAPEDVPAVLSEAWNDFVQAGDSYWKHLNRPDYPNAGDACLYCRQELGSSALRLIGKYHEYCSNTYRRERDQARSALGGHTQLITRLDVATLRDALTRKATVTDRAEVPSFFDKALQLATALAELIPQMRSEASVKVDAAVSTARDLHPTAVAGLEEAETLIATLAEQLRDRERSLSEESSKLRDLEARMLLKEIWPQVRTYVESAKWADRADTILKQKALLQSLTAASKSASEDLLNQDFARHFVAECAVLRAPNVKLDFPGRSGQAARRKSLTPTHRLSDVLSEGEQKVIALADFLAESAIRTTSAPLVFDDPVNSLDYKRLDEIAARLHSLSHKHQVIVFTHNILLAMALLTRFDKDPQNCAYYDVSAGSGDSTGVVTGGKHPRFDTPKIIRGEINALLQETKKATGAIQQALIERGYSRFRAWCEAVVEEEVLAKVTQRYRPNVMITALPKINGDRLAALTGILVPLFEKACRVTEAHSQPAETLHTRPTAGDLKQDWKAAQGALSAYQG